MASGDASHEKSTRGACALDQGPVLGIYTDVVVDPSCRTRIYAAVGFVGDLSRSRGGILFSRSNGVVGSWSAITAGNALHSVPITQVLVDAYKSQRVLASTYGRGMCEYDWGASLPACSP